MKITKKKKIATVTCVALLVAFGITMFAVGGAQGEDSSAKKAVETIKEDPTATVKEVAENVDAAKVKPTKEAKKAETTEKEAEETAASNANSANSGSDSSSSSSKPSNSNSSKPSSSNSNSSTKPSKNDSKPASTKPTHTHDWVAVYATKQVQVGTERVYVRDDFICACGYTTSDVNALTAHQKKYALADTPGHASNSLKPIYEYAPVYETQKYVDYYKCSCGATK